MLCDYELVLVISASLPDEKQKKILVEVKKVVTDASGKMKESQLLGKKKFAYPIKNQLEGFYHILTFTVEGKETAQLSNKLRLNEDILRYLLIRR